MAVVYHPPYEEFMDFMTSSPTLDEIINYRLSDPVETHIDQLLELNREGRLTAEQSTELDDYIRLEHIMRRAKILAQQQVHKPI
jgi:hypothetical protein